MSDSATTDSGTVSIFRRSAAGDTFGGALFLGGILNILSLVSYTEREAIGDAYSPISNIAGTLGHYSAGFLFLLFGNASYILGPFLLLTGFFYFYHGRIREPLLRGISLLTLLMSCSVLIYLVGGSEDTFFRSGGGVVGRRLGAALEFLFGYYGAIILGVGGLLFGAFINIETPLSVLFHRLRTTLDGTFRTVGAYNIQRNNNFSHENHEDMRESRENYKERKSEGNEMREADKEWVKRAERTENLSSEQDFQASMIRKSQEESRPWVEIVQREIAENIPAAVVGSVPVAASVSTFEKVDVRNSTDAAFCSGGKTLFSGFFSDDERSFYFQNRIKRYSRHETGYSENITEGGAEENEGPLLRPLSVTLLEREKKVDESNINVTESATRKALNSQYSSISGYPSPVGLKMSSLETLPEKLDGSMQEENRERLFEENDSLAIKGLQENNIENDSIENEVEDDRDVLEFVVPDENDEELDVNEPDISFSEEELEEFYEPEPSIAASSSDLRLDTEVPPVQKYGNRYVISKEILELPKKINQEELGREIEWTRSRLEMVLKDYGIQAKVVRLQRGPIVTLYEIKLDPGVKVSRVLGITDEIKMHLEASAVRILAPIPGRSTVGIEIPNRNRESVFMGEIVRSDPAFFSPSRQLSIALGKDIAGNNNYIDLTKLPHLLLAGATGSGKSVYMNSIIASLLYTCSPDDVRFIMIDPKMVELSLYEGIPHLLMPVITDVRRASRSLSWAVAEMERRYSMLSRLKCRDIRSYNERIKSFSESRQKMPYIVILIDELSDLMMVSAKDVEDSIIRLTQKARAVGIHVIMATQRPSVDVITALIKANSPARIAFQVAQKTDSRIILDGNGAEALVGRGDMLYKSPVASGLLRLQAPYISEDEIERIVQETRKYGEPVYVDLPGNDSDGEGYWSADEEDPEIFDQAWRVVLESGKTSTSYIQRRLRIGYNRAARLIELMEERGFLSAQIGNKPREILKKA